MPHLSRAPFSGPGRVLVGPHDRRVDTHKCPVDLADRVGVLLDVGQGPVPRPVRRSPAEPLVDRLSRPVPFRQIPPGGTGGELSQNPVEDLPPVTHRPPRPRRSQQRPDHRPGLISHFMTTHHERTNDPPAYGHALAGPPLDVLVPPHHPAMLALALLTAVAVSATPDRSTDPNRPAAAAIRAT